VRLPLAGAPRAPRRRLAGWYRAPVAHESVPGVVVAHVLQLTGVADEAGVVHRTGLPPEAVTAELDRLAASGWARYRSGAVPGWSLTAEGRAVHTGALAAELDVSGARPAVDDAYRRFLASNAELLGLCADAQLRTVDGARVPNDHADADHDAAVVARLGAVDDAVRPVLADLVAVLARFGGYAPRLSHARERVEAGEWEWLTRPTVDSYHSAWFELHEDLLRTLGRNRSDEVPSGCAVGSSSDETETR
jgi:hypothetical protein